MTPLIKTEQYLLLLSYDEVEEGEECFILNRNNMIVPFKLNTSYCDSCDGTGWYEGGKTLKTTCKECLGSGKTLDDNHALLKGMKGKIYAHLPLNNAPKLKGVLLLPPLESEEEDVEKAAMKFFNEKAKNTGVPDDYYKWDSNRHIVDKWIEGYNYKSSKGGYTKEQMILAMQFAAKTITKETLLDEGLKICEEYISSLNRFPIGVEIEMIEKDRWNKVELENETYFVPKIIGNTLQVRYCYETEK